MVERESRVGRGVGGLEMQTSRDKKRQDAVERLLERLLASCLPSQSLRTSWTLPGLLQLQSPHTVLRVSSLLRSSAVPRTMAALNLQEVERASVSAGLCRGRDLVALPSGEHPQDLHLRICCRSTKTGSLRGRSRGGERKCGQHSKGFHECPRSVRSRLFRMAQ